MARDVVLQMQVSLDGYIGLPDGGVERAFRSFDLEFTVWSAESPWKASVALPVHRPSGRVEGMAS